MGMAVASLDTVALLNDRHDQGIFRGQVGTIVEELGGGVFEVEFVNDQGETQALLPLSEADLLVLHHSTQVVA
jgi:hypothetical protein